MIKRLIKIVAMTIGVALAITALCLCVYTKWNCVASPQHYIAHGGGSIDGHTVTNTLEAVEHSIACGVKFIELDLITTSDGYVVASHGWTTFSVQTGTEYSDSMPPDLDTFKRAKVYGRYTPMTTELIDSVFRANPNLHFVTDKIRDMQLIDRHFNAFRHRMFVECFSKEQYDECERLGYTPMFSFCNSSLTGLHVTRLGSSGFCLRNLLPRYYSVFLNSAVSASMADSIFAEEPRVRFVYVDFL